MSHWFALLALVTLFGLTLFQITLIFGAPLGKFAWGGGNKVLSTRFRIASAVSIVLYMSFALFVCSKMNVIDVINNQQLLNIGLWVFTIYFFVGIGMNAISRSKPERNLMTPVAAILAVSFLVVTLA